MVLCHLWWIPLALSCLRAHGVNSEIHPNRLLKTEKFLGLPVPDCPAWRCEGRCSEDPSRTAEGKHGCYCDKRCLLYGDCCYDFFKACLSLPDEEAKDILDKDKVSSYLEGHIYSPHPNDKDLRDVAEFFQCSSGNHGSIFMDVSGFYMISQCPTSWERDITRKLCEGQSDNLLNSIPVLYERENIGFYKNKHCATCHGVPDLDMIFWDTIFTCDGKLPIAKDRRIKTFLKLLKSGRCDMKTIPPVVQSAVLQRNCLYTDLSSANCSTEEPIESLDMFCDRYTMAVRTDIGSIFQNPHCAHGCMGSNVSLSCHDVSKDVIPRPTLPAIQTEGTMSLRFFVDNNAIYPVAKTGHDIFTFPDVPDGSVVFDPFREVSLPLECPPRWRIVQSQCTPINTVPVSADSYVFAEGTKYLLLEAIIVVESDSLSCEEILKQDLFAVVLHLLESSAADVSRTCSVQTARKADQNRYYLSGANVGAEKQNKSKLSEGDSDIVESNRVRRDFNGNTRPLSDTSPVIKENDRTAPRDNSSVSVSPQLRRKLIKLAGLESEPRKKYFHVQLKTVNFRLKRITSIPAVLYGEINKFMSSWQEKGIKLEKMVVANYNETPSCKGRVRQDRHSFRFYDTSGILYGYNNVTNERIDVDKVPFAISAAVGDENNGVNLATAVWLCYLDRVDATVLDCEMSSFIEDKNDFVLKNNTLYVKSSKKRYKQGEYKVDFNGAYICNTTKSAVAPNNTDQVLLNRGFFSMPHNQNIAVLVCCCVSLACLLVIFVTYVCFSQLRDISGIILMCLTASMFIAQLLYAVGIDQSHTGPLCVTIAIALHFLWLSVFSWMNVLTYDIAHKLRVTSPDTADKNSKAFKEYCIFAWGVPFLLVGICAALDFAGGNGFQMEYAKDSCWIGEITASLVGFGLPVALLLLANFALFVCTLYALQAVARVAKLSEKQLESRKLLIIYSTLTLISGMCWGSAYIAWYTELRDVWYAFAVFNALQGIFLVCCFLLNSRVVQLYKNRFDFGNKDKQSGNLPPEEFV